MKPKAIILNNRKLVNHPWVAGIKPPQLAKTLQSMHIFLSSTSFSVSFNFCIPILPGYFSTVHKVEWLWLRRTAARDILFILFLLCVNQWPENMRSGNAYRALLTDYHIEPIWIYVPIVCNPMIFLYERSIQLPKDLVNYISHPGGC